jgi:hypothetical protein
MQSRFKKTRRLLVLALLPLVIGLFAFAFTNTNTFPGGAGMAGDGSAAISGYTVTAVAYTLNGTNPQNLDKVSFTLNAAASTVKAQLASGGSWYSCTNPASNNWECATTSPQATVAAATQLTVVAVS